MLRKTLFASLLASSALSLALVSPAAAGTTERAREAIAAAEAKIHTAEDLGAPAASPRDMADARALLATARHDFDTDHRDRAIEDGIRAQALADTAIGIAKQHHDAALASARENARATGAQARDAVAAARSQAAQTAAQAQDQVDAARDQAATAQQQAQDANARAASAEQAAAASAADASAARNAAALAVAQTPPPAPAPAVETTVTTKHAAVVHHSTPTHTVVKRTTTTSHPAAATSDDVTTTTTKVVPQ
jgi:hypothetical protein